MPAGRKPKPTKLKLVTGNPGKRALPKNEPKPNAEILPKPPSILKGEELKEWKRLGKELFRLGLLTDVDRSTFASYCVAWGSFVKAQQEIKKRGMIMKTKGGNLIQNPYLAIRNKSMEHMNKFGAEMGLSPSARARLGVTPKGNAKNGFADL